MFWLTVALFGYFLFAIVSIIDKFLLRERIPSPAVYAFYVGSFGVLVFLLAPFGFLKIPSPSIFFLALMAGIFHIFALLVLYQGMREYEVSRIIPAVGGFLPLLTFMFTVLFLEAESNLGFLEILAFIFLITGTVLITSQDWQWFSFRSLKIAFLAAFLFAVYFILIKFVFLSHPFLSAIIWSRLGAFLAALFLFLFFREVKEDLLTGPKILQKKTWLILIPGRGLAALAVLLQDWAVALAPFALLGIVNALEGTRYIFILLFATLLSIKFPGIIGEEVSRKILFQKILAIFLIGGGVVLLVL